MEAEYAFSDDWTATDSYPKVTLRKLYVSKGTKELYANTYPWSERAIESK